MKTDDLIVALSADTVPAVPPVRVFWQLVLPAVVLSAAIMLQALGLRPDLTAALHDPMVSVKSILPAVLAFGGLYVALRLARPTGRPGLAGRLLWLGPAVAAALVTLTLATQPPALWGILLMGKTMVYCITLIPALAMPVLAAALWALRRGAPIDPARAGLAAGLGAGALSAAIYSLHCPEDSPLFFAAWYGTGILIVSLLGGLLGARLLRW
ncbi:MAG: NrsF family protein [Gemmobacter sp.]